jgi:hypothetical protein
VVTEIELWMRSAWKKMRSKKNGKTQVGLKCETKKFLVIQACKRMCHILTKGSIDIMDQCPHQNFNLILNVSMVGLLRAN